MRQKGADVSAAILRVDGDTGALTGTWRGGKFVLSHFSGARPNLLEVTPAADGSLELLQNGRTKLVALRPAAARAQGLAEPTDPFHHTGVKDPSAPVEFAFPDLDGRTVALSDARFAGQGGGAGDLGELVPELPRRSAVPGRTLSQVSRRRDWR